MTGLPLAVNSPARISAFLSDCRTPFKGVASKSPQANMLTHVVGLNVACQLEAQSDYPVQTHA
ncbi:hypothetical protein AGR13a_Cc30106 [Agrobacterium genomosp. 13 str. CFBP 6927]|uniref:Uncharacterized protein n=1 Tax=Agrobacterium genomosp. 13 str. CFBP 6927 TaxID=1183428 RepID=A0ABM9VFL5_9HYPH|nr:hypothetical protein AGR13a_Cc30106 [Agrobacterium genomosp. 13 str. CFBP 6927]